MPVTSTNMNYAIVVLGAIITFAGIWFAVDARKWFKGPRMTIDNDVLNIVSIEASSGTQIEDCSFVFDAKDEKFITKV